MSNPFSDEVDRRAQQRRDAAHTAELLAAEAHEAAAQAAPFITKLGADAARTLSEHRVPPTVALVTCAEPRLFHRRGTVHINELVWDLRDHGGRLPAAFLTASGSLGSVTSDEHVWASIELRDNHLSGRTSHATGLHAAPAVELDWERGAAAPRSVTKVIEGVGVTPWRVDGFLRSAAGGQRDGLLFESPKTLVLRTTFDGLTSESDVVHALVDRVGALVTS